MLDPKAVDEVINTLRRAVPAGLTRDIEQNLRAALTATLARLDLVTREELDVQSAVLARTRARLEALEKQVAELETLLRK
jgi:BMFP domain-containing protein YqiC